MRTGGALATAGLLLGGLAACVPGAAAHGAAAAPQVSARAAVAFVRSWQVSIPGGQVVLSSPSPATIGGTASVVVGDRNGRVYAFGLRGGGLRPHWPVTVPGAYPVDSTPSVNGSIVYVGTGDVAESRVGGYVAIDTGTGRIRWYRTIDTMPGSGSVSAVQAGITVGRLDGQTAAVGGSLGQYIGAYSANSGSTAGGFPWFAADSTFSTASIVNLYGHGDYVVEGGDSTAGNAYGVEYGNGGHIRVLQPTGSMGTGSPSGGLVCQYNATQGVESSPAVGPFLGGGADGIVTGTGVAWGGAADSDKLIAVTSHCGLAWKASLDGSTQDSPALVDALGDGRLQVAEGTSTGQNSGTAYLINGSTGRTIWSRNVGGQVLGSIVSANLSRKGYQDLLVPTTGGLYVLDGRTGATVAVLGNGLVALQSAPLVTTDPNGEIGITVAGYNGGGGEVVHWEIPGSDGGLVYERGAWPMFHHDNHLSGSTIPELP